MRLTVAVCTWNRSALLEQTLSALGALRVPAGLSWECLVVANQCTDATGAVVDAAAARLPIRLVHERCLGLSYARNTAVAAATGDYILWIDDDVLVDPEWLAEYAAAVSANPEMAFFGGPIRPWFPAPPPRWLTAALPSVGNALSLLDYGSDPIALEGDRLPFGANFAIRTDVQRRHLYNPLLGRRGTRLRSGEETAVLARVLAEGGRGMWVPGAALRHFVSAERQTRRYLRRYYFHNGASHSLHGYRDTERQFLGRPLWLWREAIVNELDYQLRRPFTSPAVWGSHLRRATTAWGQLYGVAIRASWSTHRYQARRCTPPGGPEPRRLLARVRKARSDVSTAEFTGALSHRRCEGRTARTEGPNGSAHLATQIKYSHAVSVWPQPLRPAAGAGGRPGRTVAAKAPHALIAGPASPRVVRRRARRYAAVNRPTRPAPRRRRTGPGFVCRASSMARRDLPGFAGEQ
jgi:glycosyltransferase involved in cell wall biosynthesis